MSYKYYQPNKKDLKDRQGDCCIRAICKFFDIEWVQAFDKLVKYARETQTMINSMDNVTLYMDSIGIPYTSIYRERMTVSEFAKKHKVCAYICYVRAGFGTHLVCIQDGIYYDTWDCGDKIIYGYWRG